MSRTDKDAPWWVRVEFYEPEHSHCPNAAMHSRRWLMQQLPVTRECDLPEEPVRHNWRQAPRHERYSHCTWEPSGWDRKYYTRPPRSYDRRIYFHGPSRRVFRDFCQKAKQEFAGSGEVELIDPNPRIISQLDWWD